MSAVVTLSAKGQLTLPAEIRRRLGLHRGDRFFISQTDDGLIVVEPAPSLEEVSARLTQDAADRGVAPLTDVDSFYQANR